MLHAFIADFECQNVCVAKMCDWKRAKGCVNNMLYAHI